MGSDRFGIRFTSNSRENGGEGGEEWWGPALLIAIRAAKNVSSLTRLTLTRNGNTRQLVSATNRMLNTALFNVFPYEALIKPAKRPEQSYEILVIYTCAEARIMGGYIVGII